jgi:hypothetical protein
MFVLLLLWLSPSSLWCHTNDTTSKTNLQGVFGVCGRFHHWHAPLSQFTLSELSLSIILCSLIFSFSPFWCTFLLPVHFFHLLTQYTWHAHQACLACKQKVEVIMILFHHLVPTLLYYSHLDSLLG